MLIPMFDGLRQGDPLWDNQAGAPTFARQHPLAIGPHEDAPIAVPAITEPGEGTLVVSLHGDRYCLLDQVVVQLAGGTGHHKATGSVLHKAPPAFSLIWLAGCTVFSARTRHYSSISTWLRCRSLASTCVRAAAWVAARFSQQLIVSYLCPVISSAARRLPRRITINRARATSAAGVFSPFIGVPCVSPKYVLQLRH